MNWVRKVHKWTSVLVGIQFLIWLGSGMYFNFMDHMKAAGHTYKNHQHQSFNWSNVALVEPSMVLQQQPASTSLELIVLNDSPYYLLNHQRGLYPYFENKHSLVDALHGRAVTMDEEFAKTLALSSYSGPGQVLSVTLLQPPLEDFPKQKMQPGKSISQMTFKPVFTLKRIQVGWLATVIVTNAWQTSF